MRQTTTYKLNLIETSDPFSPDALNENANTLETQLARVDGEFARVDAAASAETARVNDALAAKAAQTEITRLDAALAKCARIVHGTYTGKGEFGRETPNELDFADTLGCAPKLLIVHGPSYFYTLTAINGITGELTFSHGTSSYTCSVSWTETGVSWHSGSNAQSQLNEKDKTYYYVAFA